MDKDLILTVVLAISLLIVAVGLISYSPDTQRAVESPHAVVPIELHDPVYVNYDDAEDSIKEVCLGYSQYMPKYMKGETDCDDMAVYLWNKLQEKGVKTFLVIGSVDGRKTPFNRCDHAWLYCQTPDGGITVEPTIPAVIFSNGYFVFHTSDEINDIVESVLVEDLRDGNISLDVYKTLMNNETFKKKVFEETKCNFIEDSTMSEKYRYGFFYAKPSDLRADIGNRW